MHVGVTRQQSTNLPVNYETEGFWKGRHMEVISDFQDVRTGRQ